MTKAILVTAAALVAGNLCAQEKGLDFGLKLRAQTGFQTVDGMLNGFGFGLSSSLPVGSGRIGGELGYQYFSGKGFREPIKSNPFSLTNANSVDYRKYQAEGLFLRAFYQGKMGQSWGWQIGAMAAKLKGRQESIGTFGTSGAYGAWNLAPEKSAISFSPYAGVTYDLGEKGAFEINVLFASYKVPVVDPQYNSGAAGYGRVTPLVGEKTISKPKLELCYAFKF